MAKTLYEAANRIIPAHAGNTTRTPFWLTLYTDHPRACGEHGTKPNNTCHACGSSPRMRGTQELIRRPRTQRRIIPAHAGNTQHASRVYLDGPDHPRACGEHRLFQELKRSGRGSSPRMRGTLHCRPAALTGWRIIPAHAGNTSPARPEPDFRADHPRACGEHGPSMDFP